MLDQETVKRIIKMHSEGMTQTRIAQTLGISTRTVYRKLKNPAPKPRDPTVRRGRRSPISEIDQRPLLETYIRLGCNVTMLHELVMGNPQQFGLPEGFSMTYRSLARHLTRKLGPSYKLRRTLADEGVAAKQGI